MMIHEIFRRGVSWISQFVSVLYVTYQFDYGCAGLSNCVDRESETLLFLISLIVYFCIRLCMQVKVIFADSWMDSLPRASGGKRMRQFSSKLCKTK